MAVLLDLADHLSALTGAAGETVDAKDISNLSRARVRADGWGDDRMLRRLARVAPVDLDEQAFLARCKVLHERVQAIPKGVLKRILRAMGVPPEAMRDLGSLKLLQALTNVVRQKNRDLESVADALPTEVIPDGWNEQNDMLAPLFVLNDLRIADAHVTPGDALVHLRRLGFDLAGVNDGHGVAFDLVLDKTVESLGSIEGELRRFTRR
ncbi:hypothetical protein KPL74_08750 [Bacillus sp. NP157]|nr:hypothetical protein KPL74_08750 [Bacillus sp. NP157]